MSAQKTLSLSLSKKMWRRFYGNVKGFKPQIQPTGFEVLPPVFLQAKELWEKGKERNLPDVIELLTPYLRATFALEQLPRAEELIANPEHLPRAPEFKATELRLVGVDFAEGPLPTCKIEAEFNLPVTVKFKETDLRKWQNLNGPLSQAVCFYWEVPVEDNVRIFKSGGADERDCGAIIVQE